MAESILIVIVDYYFQTLLSHISKRNTICCHKLSFYHWQYCRSPFELVYMCVL